MSCDQDTNFKKKEIDDAPQAEIKEAIRVRVHC